MVRATVVTGTWRDDHDLVVSEHRLVLF